MRLFKHGDSLAIVIPENLRRKFTFKENQEFEFFELDEGALIVFNRDSLAKQVKNKAIAEILQKFSSVSVQLPPLVVFSTEAEAKIAAKKFETQIKSGELLAVPGTDKKIYFLSTVFYSTTSSKLTPLLEKEKTLSEICTESGLGQREVFATLQVMKEKGEVIEKKKGSYLIVK